MLNTEWSNPRSNDAIIQSLTDDPSLNSVALACPVCPHYEICGGLCVPASIFDCLDLCCGNPNHCSRVCRNNPIKFVQQMREIGSFNLWNVDRTPEIPVPLDYDIVPLIYHGSGRAHALQNAVFALRLPDLINYKTGELRFHTRKDLCHAFRIDSASDLLLSGVDHDRRIEPWWTLGEKRIPLIRAIKELGVKLVTTPNFSVVLDHPRTDNLYAMKRIGIIFAEFQNGGIACALHPNGRTPKDFERWAGFIRERPEVRVLAYEFITGTARILRKPFHLERLADLAKAAGRELDIIIRGDPSVIPFLRRHFRNLIYIETTSFMKTIKRQRAERLTNRKLDWNSAPTAIGEYVDELFGHNREEETARLRALYFGAPGPYPKAA